MVFNFATVKILTFFVKMGTNGQSLRPRKTKVKSTATNSNKPQISILLKWSVRNFQPRNSSIVATGRVEVIKVGSNG